MEITPVAYYHGDFPEKFGIPRQSGVAEELSGYLEFEPPFRDREALRGLEGFSDIWLIWEFSAAGERTFRPTVRPPRLGGNVRMGIWATRSPFRPNPLGLSAVKVERIDLENMRIHVRGADLMDGTPVYDIKPYIPYADSRPEAAGGFAKDAPEAVLNVVFRAGVPFSPEKTEALRKILSLDPRPPYQDIPGREYGLLFAGYDVRFTVNGADLVVTRIEKV